MISRENIFDLRKKKEIYDFISSNPGLYLREISKKINIPLSTLSFHIKYLMKYGLIESRSMGRFKRYWVSNKIGLKEKELLSLLRNEKTCNIIFLIYSNLICTQIEISRELEMNPSAVNYHLKNLIKLGIIEEAPYKNGLVDLLRGGYSIKRDRVGNEIFYKIKNVEVLGRLFNVLIAYHKSIPDNFLIESLVYMFPELHEKNPLSKYKILDLKKHNTINIAIDNLTELFPLPFCA